MFRTDKSMVDSMVDVHVADTADYFRTDSPSPAPAGACQAQKPSCSSAPRPTATSTADVEILGLDPVEVQRVTEDSRPSDPA
jgi:hypothetical protein